MKACRPTRQNWCTPENALIVGVVLDDDVTAERRRVAEDGVVADVAIVRDVRVRHEHVVIADLRDPAAARGAAVNGDELAEHVAVADRQPGRLAAGTSGPAGSGRPRRTERSRCHRRSRYGPSITVDAPIAAVAADPDVLADDGMRPDRRCRRRYGVRWTTALGSMIGRRAARGRGRSPARAADPLPRRCSSPM